MMRVACVVSRFNQEITEALYQGARQRLAECGIDVSRFDVPGAVEIPLIAQRLAKLNQFDALICLGAVIRGETSHYDYVCEQVSNGCQQVMLSSEIPVIFGVLTVENEEQAWDRLGGAHGHKGIECADTAQSMIRLLRELDNLENRK